MADRYCAVCKGTGWIVLEAPGGGGMEACCFRCNPKGNNPPYPEPEGAA